MSEHPPGYIGTQNDVVTARVGAFVIDYVVSLVLGVVVGFAAATALNSAVGIYLGLPAAVLGYYVVLEGATGQTLGKRVTGIVVVSEGGSPITFRQAVVRNVLRIVDGLFNYALGLVVMLIEEDTQRVGDIVADTLVVRSRT